MIKNPGMIGGKKYTSKEYFIFNPDYTFKGQLQQAKDFVFKCKIRCYGVLVGTGRPECPHLFYCVNKEHFSGMMKLSRKDYEIFETFEECLAANEKHPIQEGKSFEDYWIEQAKKGLEQSIKFGEGSIKSIIQTLEEKKQKLENINSLIF